jgi:hypothetical protein
MSEIFNREMNTALLIAGIFGCLLILFLMNKLREGFAAAATATPVTFLTRAKTSAFLLEDADGYVRNMSFQDLNARQAPSHEEYLTMASAAAQDFTSTQKALLTETARRADAVLQREMAAIPWRFALVGRDYEEGLPHTRADIIFLAPHILTSPNLLSTLIHEKVHVWQRRNPAGARAWVEQHGYRRTVTRESRREAGLRANPDVDAWIYEDPRTGQEMAAYYVRRRPNSIGEVSLTHPSFEHPYEYMAYATAARYSDTI